MTKERIRARAKTRARRKERRKIKAKIRKARGKTRIKVRRTNPPVKGKVSIPVARGAATAAFSCVFSPAPRAVDTSATRAHGFKGVAPRNAQQPHVGAACARADALRTYNRDA